VIGKDNNFNGDGNSENQCDDGPIMGFTKPSRALNMGQDDLFGDFHYKGKNFQLCCSLSCLLMVAY